MKKKTQFPVLPHSEEYSLIILHWYQIATTRHWPIPKAQVLVSQYTMIFDVSFGLFVPFADNNKHVVYLKPYSSRQGFILLRICPQNPRLYLLYQFKVGWDNLGIFSHIFCSLAKLRNECWQATVVFFQPPNWLIPSSRTASGSDINNLVHH